MAATGYSIDRRAQMHLDDVYNSSRVRQLVCLVCAQSKTDMGVHRNRLHVGWNGPTVHEENISDIAYRSGKDLWSCFARHRESFELNLGFREFVRRYAAGHDVGEGAFANATEVQEDNWEWRRVLRGPGTEIPVPLLCCPEDVEKCGSSTCSDGDICNKCRVAVCRDCWLKLLFGKGIPMSLCNDNLWGYATAIITRYKVRWIEMAAVLPVWTNMIVWHISAGCKPRLHKWRA